MNEVENGSVGEVMDSLEQIQSAIGTIITNLSTKKCDAGITESEDKVEREDNVERLIKILCIYRKHMCNIRLPEESNNINAYLEYSMSRVKRVAIIFNLIIDSLDDKNAVIEMSYLKDAIIKDMTKRHNDLVSTMNKREKEISNKETISVSELFRIIFSNYSIFMSIAHVSDKNNGILRGQYKHHASAILESFDNLIKQTESIEGKATYGTIRDQMIQQMRHHYRVIVGINPNFMR